MSRRLLLTPAMAATLASLSGCSSGGDDWDDGVVADRNTRICVNEAGERIEDFQCDTTSGRYIGGTSSRWYYLNRRSRVPYYGDAISRSGVSGSPVAAPGESYAAAPERANVTRSAAVKRGGFGSLGRSFGGGRS
ncbi:hypothetical protein B0I00_0272 [Novosphingobium kunmingense]|uniref:Uncharacterized protein n=1 Tax=Novosphingobium kunmingense TaxID=1211806 RepID=A0A2N0I1P7_9SPHN|nr:hypothetical protein [Novosphingobium kunmingense]PKB25091.1 hypothetical protein B0I00_0272 [Novosphingobium kunmingense]